ncbi:MAG TPA: RNA polymerase sigma factor [Chloroflexia bacterium]|nr:RNA polymerase sigma factor [Chloroflexia bacterium]
MDEKSAIAQMKQGNIDGLETIVKRYESKAIETSYLISHDAALAEDIVQAAFLRAFERIGQFDSQRSFGPWFLRSVINDTLRALERGSHILGNIDTLDQHELERLASAKDDLYDELEAAETKDEILLTLSRLSPVQRAAIVLRYYLDLSEIEMAQMLDCPKGTVKRRLHDARKNLRQLLPKWIRQTGE